MSQNLKHAGAPAHQGVDLLDVLGRIIGGCFTIVRLVFKVVFAMTRMY